MSGIILKPKIINSKMENLSSGLFLRLEEWLALYLNRGDMRKDFSFLRCILRVRAHTESLFHQDEKVQK